MKRKAPKLTRSPDDDGSQYKCRHGYLDSIIIDSTIPGSHTTEKVLNVLKEDKLSLDEKLKVVNEILNYLMELHKLEDPNS